jgi:uracil-DNA glycosylase family 4
MFVESHPSALSAITGLPLSDPEVSMAFSKTLRWLGLSRHEVYTTSLLKCANSEPTPAEWTRCRTHFERELQLARPAYIITLGALTSQILLNSSGPLIGEWSEISGVPVLSTHHFSDAVHPQGVALKHQMAAHLNRLRARLEREGGA